MSLDPGRKGTALLEVLVGFVLLAVAGVAWTVLASQTARTLREVQQREREISAAAALLERRAVLSRAELESLVGRSRSGAFDVTITPVDPGLYDVVVTDTLTATTTLHTSIHPIYAIRDTAR